MPHSRERIHLALNHQEADRIPVDFGGSGVTGMHVSTVYRLRQALGMDTPGTPVKIVDPFSLRGEIKADLIHRLELDTIPLEGTGTVFGYKKEGWKPWTTFDGTPVLVPEKFNTDPEPNGDILMYPAGDKTAPPSGRMPRGGFYFDAIIRQPPIDEDRLNVEDNVEEFGPVSDSELNHFKTEAERLYEETDLALFANFGGTQFGNQAILPAPWLKHPKGIRDLEEWFVSLMTRRDYVYRIFECQCEIALKNLEKIHQAVANRVSVIYVSGTDFGTQKGPFISPRIYRDLFKPFFQQVNDWIHKHTSWKTFIHSCGSVSAFIEDFIESGFDILNPVQCSAAQMDPRELKEGFGDRVTFWGGGVNTQQTLPFGTPEEVKREVRERIKIFGKGGGFVFNAIHNIQPQTPIENVLAMFEAIREHGHYPL
jgi:hypothetical protein